MNKFPSKISEFLQISDQDVSNVLKNLSNPLILKWAFLGDILLGYIVTMCLSKKFKDSSIHELTLFRAMIVCNKTLAYFCDEIFNQDIIINIKKLNAHSKGTIIEALIYRATEINGIKLIKEKIYLMTNLVFEINEIEFEKTKIQIKNPNFEESIYSMTMIQQNSLILENEIYEPLMNSFLNELSFYAEKPKIKVEPKNEEKKSEILINEIKKKENIKSNEKEKKKLFDPKIMPVSRPEELKKLKIIIENLKKNQNINFYHFGKIIPINWRSRKGNDYINYFYSCCGIPSLIIEINKKENCGRMNWKNPNSYHPGELILHSSRKKGGGIAPIGNSIDNNPKCNFPKWTCCDMNVDEEGCHYL